MSDAVPLELGPLSIAAGPTRRGRTELQVSAFGQELGHITTSQPLELEALLASESDAQALFALFREHCAPLLRQRAQHGPGSIETLCIRLTHPCENPQCDAVHELLCMNTALGLLAQAAPATASDGIPFTLVDEHGQPQAAPQHLGDADTERLLLEHTAPALVEMASFFSPASLHTELARWEPPTPADQDIISYFGFFSGLPDALYGIYQYINPLLLGIWMDRIDAGIHSHEHAARAAAQQAWFQLLAKLHILPEGHLASAAAADSPPLGLLTPATGGSRRLH
ncbi:hypothetical protein H4O09_10170 [Stenotrophomonas sp. W1S232]|uniref:Uncharacterized protein n=1 Tax=Stenotrophomonas koreensis TaxID=266128 RepID=A0A7W3V1M2_9GAMM|nr:hypothetical protein [Stenotrophomonas koreensis]MBB1117412.1 hypothetical protein [Stenotrophomonas koreensis]